MSDDPWFRAGRKVGRAIDEGQTPPAVSGRVDSAPDTVQKTVPVKIGGKIVTASYLGTTPEVGAQVVVQQNGPDWLMIQQVPKPAVNVGAAGVPLLPLVPGAGRPPITGFSFWGHSFTHSPGSPLKNFDYATPWFPLESDAHQMSPWRIDRVLAGMVGVDEDHVRHWGVGGAVLLSDNQLAYPVPGIQPGQTRHGWAWILQLTSNRAWNRFGWPPQTDPYANQFSPDAHTHLDSIFSPFLPMSTAHVALFGCNDAGFWGPPTATVDGVANMILTAWTEANRAIISRFRAGAILENDVLYSGATPGRRYGFTYTGSWITVGGEKAGPVAGPYVEEPPLTLYNSGTSMTRLTSGSGTIVLHLGADWPGGVVTFRFRGEPSTGGSVTITQPTGTPVTFSTAHRMPSAKTSIPHSDDATVASTAFMNVPPWVASFGVIARRIVVPRIAGVGTAQTISVSVDASGGPVWFDGCDLEQTGMAPPVVMANTPLPARWPAAYSTQPTWAASPDAGNAFQPAVGSGDTTGKVRGPQVTEAGDAWAIALNTALTTVVAEFADTASSSASLVASNTVQIADLYSAMNGITNPELYVPEDILHPNPAGTTAAAGAFYRALCLATANAQSGAALGAA